MQSLTSVVLCGENSTRLLAVNYQSLPFFVLGGEDSALFTDYTVSSIRRSQWQKFSALC